MMEVWLKVRKCVCVYSCMHAGCLQRCMHKRVVMCICISKVCAHTRVKEHVRV